jgi:hypothetical protein
MEARTTLAGPWGKRFTSLSEVVEQVDLAGVYEPVAQLLQYCLVQVVDCRPTISKMLPVVCKA